MKSYLINWNIDNLNYGNQINECNETTKIL